MSNSFVNSIVDDIHKPIFALHMAVKNYDTGVHHHTRHQLLYAEGGALHFFANDEQFILPAHHAAWIPAGLDHKLVSRVSQLYFRSIYIDASEVDVAFPQRLTIFPVTSLAREMIQYTQRWHYFDDSVPAETAFYTAFCHLIPEWCRQAIDLVLPTTAHPQLLEITQFMLAHLDETLTIQQVSQRFSMSSRTLMRMFRNEFDMTFQEYLRTARIINALELLSLPDVNVTDVALQVGYKSMSSFSQAFKLYVGKSPKTIQQEMRR